MVDKKTTNKRKTWLRLLAHTHMTFEPYDMMILVEIFFQALHLFQINYAPRSLPSKCTAHDLTNYFHQFHLPQTNMAQELTTTLVNVFSQEFKIE